MTLRFMVVTEVPDADGPDAWLNLAIPSGPIYWQIGRDAHEVCRVHGTQQLSLRAPVFCLGEVLIVDGSGREVCGHGRKPAKWGVATKTFESIDEALACAKALVGT